MIVILDELAQLELRLSTVDLRPGYSDRVNTGGQAGGRANGWLVGWLAGRLVSRSANVPWSTLRGEVPSYSSMFSCAVSYGSEQCTKQRVGPSHLHPFGFVPAHTLARSII